MAVFEQYISLINGTAPGAPAAPVHYDHGMTIEPLDKPVIATGSFQSLAALINQYAAAGFHNEHDGAGQMTPSPDKQGHQENLALLTSPHHHG